MSTSLTSPSASTTWSAGGSATLPSDLPLPEERPNGQRLEGWNQMLPPFETRAARAPQDEVVVLPQTSTHSASTSSAMRRGLMRKAERVEPAAGTTSSKAFSETSQ